MTLYSLLPFDQKLWLQKKIEEELQGKTYTINGKVLSASSVVLKGVKSDYCCANCWESFYNCCCTHD